MACQWLTNGSCVTIIILKRRDGGAAMKIADLKKRKEELGYTNEMISEMSGVPLGTVQKFFGGATSRPRYNTLQSIECVLFPENHTRQEATLYKGIVHNLSLDRANRVSESSALAEYSFDVTDNEYKVAYEKVLSWKKPGEFTVEDWKNLPDGVWMELIDGVLYDRNYPTKRHQFVATRLAFLLNVAIERKGGPCLLLAPAGVQPDEQDNKNAFIPDVMIICDREKYTKDEDIIVGAPDYVAEILSPSTEKYDRTVKLNKYWQQGVREYWIIDIQHREVIVYRFDKPVPPVTYSFEDQIPLGISEGGIVIDFKNISDRLRDYFGE